MIKLKFERAYLARRDATAVHDSMPLYPLVCRQSRERVMVSQYVEIREEASAEKGSRYMQRATYLDFIDSIVGVISQIYLNII